MTIDVCIPHLPQRGLLLRRAVASVCAQQLPADNILIATDLHGEGAARTRNRALAMSSADFVAFLDDDDELLPQHLAVLYEAVVETGCDLAYSWFQVPNGWDPFRVDGMSPFGRPFDDRMREAMLNESNFVPITVLARREFIMDVGGFPEPWSERWPHGDCEDWGMWQDCLRAGAKFTHVPQVTWLWHWWGGNTSGMAS